ncbi:MAG: AraC family transcriptional regulator [Myxococcota bacterium]
MGRYVSGRTWAHFCVDAGLWGVVLWGRPGLEDALALGRSLVTELKPRIPRHASVVDASRLEAGDEGAFAQLQWYLTEQSDALARAVSRLALVRPPGVRGALVAGAYEVVKKPYPVRLFESLAGALEWLDASAARGAIEATTREAMGTPGVVAELREYLGAHLSDDVSLARAAKALKTSERSLQRRLGEAGATFQGEVADARVRAAQARLKDTDAPLTTIAMEVGCASLQHFNALFKRRTGVSPSAWRKRQRAR